LFLSMVPLHADRFAAQEAFIARGLQTFTEVAKRSVSVPEKAIA
jgi:hypothetical protein